MIFNTSTTFNQMPQTIEIVSDSFFLINLIVIRFVNIVLSMGDHIGYYIIHPINRLYTDIQYYTNEKKYIHQFQVGIRVGNYIQKFKSLNKNL